MNIGTLAARAGTSPKMIRYYEKIELVRPVPRSPGGYRVYGKADLHTLRFVGRARHLGFTLADARRRLDLWRDRTRSSADVCRLATRHLTKIDRRIAALQSLRRILLELVDAPSGTVDVLPPDLASPEEIWDASSPKRLPLRPHCHWNA